MREPGECGPGEWPGEFSAADGSGEWTCGDPWAERVPNGATQEVAFLGMRRGLGIGESNQKCWAMPDMTIILYLRRLVL